jgi:hypothetical protein
MEQFSNQDMGAMLLVLGITFAIVLAIEIVVCLILSNALSRIPQQFRQIEPGMVWLLLIPCFNVVWNFFVFPKVARSYRAYFASRGDDSHGDCGETLGWWYAGVYVGTVVPCLNYLAGPAALILLIILLVKFSGLKNHVVEGGGPPPM